MNKAPDEADPSGHGTRCNCPDRLPQGPAQMQPTPWIWNLQQLPRLVPAEPHIDEADPPTLQGTHETNPLDTELAKPPVEPRPHEADPPLNVALAPPPPFAGPPPR